MLTIKQLAELSGVSTRTLRYYDEIGLLPPADLSDSGYRLYTQVEIDRLQQILLYREMGMKLSDIKELLKRDDRLNILEQHLSMLLHEQRRIEGIVAMVKKTIQHARGEITMTNEEKFNAFKREKLKENEAMFGREARQRFGHDAVDHSNQQWMNLTQDEMEEAERLESELVNELNIINSHGIDDLNDEHMKQAFDAHRSWLAIMAPFYNEEYHRGLADMYVGDDRFSKYYNDKTSEESAELLRDIIYHYTEV